MDGTLIDSTEWAMDSIQKAFQKNNLKARKKEIYKYWGLKVKELIKKLFPKLKKSELNKIYNDYVEIREKNIYKLKPFKNTKKTLKKLSKKYTLAIVSNNPHSLIERLLKITKINKKLFKLIVGDDEVRCPKPFPDEIYKAEKRFKKKVQFMVGDTIQDIKTAKAAKVKSIIILTGPKSTWKNLNKADYKIKDIKELPNLIKEKN